MLSQHSAGEFSTGIQEAERVLNPPLANVRCISAPDTCAFLLLYYQRLVLRTVKLRAETVLTTSISA